MTKIMAAHQPNFLPYLGFFEKMKQADVFIIRDDCQFSKRDYHHRNRIRIQDGPEGARSDWVTIPVDKKEIPLKEVRIKQDLQEKNQPWQTLRCRQVAANYHRAPFFEQQYQQFEKAIHGRHEKLIDLTMELIRQQAAAFSITTPILMATEIPGFTKSGDASQDLVNLTKLVNADTYLSGSGGRTYLDLEPFRKAGITVRFQEYTPVPYTQMHEGFLPYMAAIDALFMIGKMPE